MTVDLATVVAIYARIPEWSVQHRTRLEVLRRWIGDQKLVTTVHNMAGGSVPCHRGLCRLRRGGVAA